MTMTSADTTERLHGQRSDRLWDLIQRDWAGDDPQRWKMLACIHLRLHCQWPLELIGQAFGHARGHVLRLVNSGLAALRSEYVNAPREGAATDLAPLADLLAPSGTELERRIACCREELDIWQRLREQHVETSLWGEGAQRPQIVPGSLRERVAECLLENGPHHSRQIALALRTRAGDVRRILWECPEFFCDAIGLWSLHGFAGQECLGVDVESAPSDSAGSGGTA